MLCDATVRVDTRKNYRLLGVFTLCYGYILAVLSVYQYSKGSIIVAVAVAITFVLAFLLMLFAFQTKRDFLRGNKPFWPVEFLQGSVFCRISTATARVLILAECGVLSEKIHDRYMVWCWTLIMAVVFFVWVDNAAFFSGYL